MEDLADLFTEFENYVSGIVVLAGGLLLKFKGLGIRGAVKKTDQVIDNLEELGEHPLSEIVGKALDERLEPLAAAQAERDAVQAVREAEGWAKHDGCHERIEAVLKQLQEGQIGLAEAVAHIQGRLDATPSEKVGRWFGRA